MRLAPTFLVLACLTIAWRWAWPGAGCLLPAGGRVQWRAVLSIAGPLWLVGLLFLARWWLERGQGMEDNGPGTVGDGRRRMDDGQMKMDDGQGTRDDGRRTEGC